MGWFKHIDTKTLTTLVKDVLFIAIGLLLLSRRQWIGMTVGAVVVFLYGREALLTWQAARQESSTSGFAHDDGKLKVTNLDDAKEVEFEKE